MPAKPTGLQVDTKQGSLDVSVDWDDVTHATHYLVRWRSVDNEEELNQGVEVLSSEATITLESYGQWVVRLEACNASDCGPPLARRFDVSPAPTPAPSPNPTQEPTPDPSPTPTPDPTPQPVSIPAEPTGLQVGTEPGSLDVSLDWDDVDGADDYLVRWRSVDNGEKLNEGVEVQSSDTDITLKGHGEWAVRVQACNIKGCGAHLTQKFEVESIPGQTPTPEPTPDPTPQPVSIPAEPTGLQVSTEPGSLDVSLDWDDVDGADDYLVRWRSVDNGEKLNEGVEVQSSDTDITLKGHGEWAVRVQACNIKGCGAHLTQKFEVESIPGQTPTPEPTPDPTPQPVSIPAEPTGLQVGTEPGSLDVSLDWDDVDGADDYLVRWRVSGSGNSLNEGIRPTSSDASITVDDHGEWVVRIKACNDLGCGQHLTRGFQLEPSPESKATPEPAPEDGLSPLFPYVISRVDLEKAGAIDDLELPEVKGGDDGFTYSLAPLPLGLSFDLDTRILSGTVAAGRYALTYTATDGAGVRASFSFTITVGTAQRTARSQSENSEDIDFRRPTVENLSVERKTYREPTAPGLLVTWDPPDMSKNASGENDLTVVQYHLRYTKGAGFIYAITNKDTNRIVLPSLVPGEEYLIYARPKYEGERYPEWSYFYRRTNSLPRFADGRLNPAYIMEVGGDDSVQTISDDFTDPDGDTLTYSVSSTRPGIVTATLEDGDNSTKDLRIHVVSPAPSTVTFGAHDGYGGYVFQNISVSGFSNLTRDVAEDAATGTAVGAPVAGTPYGTETLTYTLSGDIVTSGAFGIDSATGQIRVAEGATLDHEDEDNNSYTGKVSWRVQGAAAEADLTINVTDANEPPLPPQNLRVTDLTDTSFTLEWDPPDNTGRPDIIDYVVQAVGEWRHRTDKLSVSYTGLVPGTTYDFKISAHNDEGFGDPAEFSVTTLEYLPKSADFTKYFRVGENAAFVQRDFPFFASPNEEDDVLANVKITAIPTSEGAFKLKQSDGTQSDVAQNDLIAAADLGNLLFVPVTNFDGTASAQFKVIDQEGDESENAYALTLRQVVNIPPRFSEWGPLSMEVPENSPAGTAVGDPVTATDEDSEDTLTYSLSGTDASSFAINSGTGQISVAAGTVLDYEGAKNTYQVLVGVSDGMGLQGGADVVVDTYITVDIAVTNVNEGPPPVVNFSITAFTATTMRVDLHHPDTTGTSPIDHYIVAYKADGNFNILASPVEYDGYVTVNSGTTARLTGLSPSTTYYVKVVAVNMDGEVGSEPSAQTATTSENPAPDSANFIKTVFRQTGATFSANDFPFTDAEAGDSLDQVKIVTLPIVDRDSDNRRQGELRFDGVAATAGQVVSAADLGKLRYVPQPDGWRFDIDSSFTFRVLDQDGAESPTYTVTLLQMADIKLSLSPDSIYEGFPYPHGVGEVTVTATLTGPVRDEAIEISELRIDPDWDALEHSDYQVRPENKLPLTIPAGQKSGSAVFSLNGYRDYMVEVREWIRFYPVWKDGETYISAQEYYEAGLLLLEDIDRAAFTLSGPPGEVEEGENAEFTVRLSRRIATPLSVAWSVIPGGTADPGSDFLADGGTVTFPAGSGDNATMTISIPVIDDLVPEASESFSLVLGNISGWARTQVSIMEGQGEATADIAESDSVTVSVSGDERVMEGESATYTIALSSAASTHDITVDYVTTDYTALDRTDYTAATGTVTIPAGQTSATVTVPTLDNTDDEANRYFAFSVSNPQGGGGPPLMLATTQSVNTTIVDDDGDPSSVVLTVDKTSFGESDSVVKVKVTATLEGVKLAQDTTIAVTLGGSATQGSSGDYTATTLGNITITSGETVGTSEFALSPVGDEVVEGDETILLQGAAAGLDVTPATITINDDDTATLSITGPTGVVGEGTSAEFTVTLSHEVAERVVVAWSAGSTAQVPASADDYSPDSGSVIFEAGGAAGATRTITMAIADDEDDEDQETFTVSLGSVTGDLASRVSVDSAKNSVDVTIATGEVVTVTLVGPRAFSHTTYTGQPVNTDQAVYHVFISGPVNADVMVDIVTSDGTATGCDWENDANGIATCETGQRGDYGSASETLTIGPTRDDFLGNDVRVLYNTISVPLIGNATGDPDETFTVSISNLRGGGTTPVVLGDSSVTTTITEDPLTVQVGGLEFVDEGTNARFVVSRNVDLHPALGLRVGYYTKSTEDPDAATVTEDYPYTAGTLEIPVNLTRFATLEEYRQRYSDWEVLVPIVADNIDEPDEDFFLIINVPEIYDPGTEWAQDGVRRIHTHQTWIRDRAMRVSVSGPETATEGGYADFTVSLSRPPTANLTVNYQTYSALAPLELATSGEDFTALAGTLTFAPGETSKRVRVPLLTDSITEPIEYFRLLLSNPFGGGGLTPTLSVGEATMGIVDVAGPLYGATMTVSPDSNIGEGDAAASSFTVKVDLDCCTTFVAPTTVTISLGGTATGTDEYTANVANVTIPASTATGSATLTLTPVDDAIVEGDETIVVNGSATVQLNGTSTGLLIIPTTLDLTDNDTAAVGITGPSAEVAEGANAEFTVTLSTEIAKDTTVAWSAPLRSDTAAATDLRATSGTITFAAGSAAGSHQTISIPVIDDSLPEAAETFTVTLGTVGGDLADLVTVDFTASSAAATIAESDRITINISGPTSVDEGDATTAYTVSLSPSGVTLTADLTVDYATSDGTATAGRDYTAELETLTFTRRATGDQTFRVRTREDILDEGTGETFTVTISNPSGGGGPVPSLGTSSVTTTITDDDDAPVLSISSATKSVTEGGSATYTVKLEGSRTTDVTVDLETGDDNDLATAGADYTAVSTTLTFQPTDDTKTVTVQTLTDKRIELPESFTVSLSNAQGGGGSTPVIRDGTKTTTIDDDFQGRPDYPNSYNLMAAPTTLDEGDGATQITFTATLRGENTFPNDADVVVLLAGWWEGATATVTEDYTVSGSHGSLLRFSIPANDKSASGTLTLTPSDDTLVEDDETIIFDSLGGGGMRASSKATITITDNDSEAAGITLSANPSILREGPKSATTNVVVTATLDDTTPWPRRRSSRCPWRTERQRRAATIPPPTRR